MQFSLSSIPKQKVIFVVTMVAIFFSVGIANHLYKEAPKAPVLVIGNLLTLSGRGNLPDLHTAMAQDGQLKRMIGDLAAIPAPQVFTHQKEVDAMVAAILFRWAGADMAQKEADGPYIDSRVVAFLRRIGSFPVTPGTGNELGIKQATDLDQLWFKIFDHYRMPLLAQTAAKDVYGGGVSYDPNSKKLKVTGEVSPDFIKAFESDLQTSRNSGETMRGFLDFIDGTKGFTSLSEKEQDLIMSVTPPKPKIVPPPAQHDQAAGHVQAAPAEPAPPAH